jgi:hypothetical protein
VVYHVHWEFLRLSGTWDLTLRLDDFPAIKWKAVITSCGRHVAHLLSVFLGAM